MNAEPDLQRKVRRVASVMKVGAREAAAIATYKAPAMTKPSPAVSAAARKSRDRRKIFSESLSWKRRWRQPGAWRAWPLPIAGRKAPVSWCPTVYF